MVRSVLYRDHVGLWREELRAWMPDEIFDAHAHLGPSDAMGPIAAARRQEPLSTFTALTVEELFAWYRRVYRGKTVTGLIAFGFPLREVRYDLANEYVASLARRDPRVRGFLLANPRNTSASITEYFAHKKRGARFSGVKPYYDLLGKDIPRSVYHTQMSEFVPDDLLEFMDSERLVLMLHTSSIGMGDPECQKFIRSALARFPRVKIVLAHMGRYLLKEQYFAFFDSGLLDHPNLFLEISSASQPEVYKKTLTRRDLWQRLLFGSDLPFGLITGEEYWSKETGPIFITREKYSWTDEKIYERFRARRRRVTYNTYHTLHALKVAVDALACGDAAKRQLKEDIFLNNARARLFAGAAG